MCVLSPTRGRNTGTKSVPLSVAKISAKGLRRAKLYPFPFPGQRDPYQGQEGGQHLLPHLCLQQQIPSLGGLQTPPSVRSAWSQLVANPSLLRGVQGESNELPPASCLRATRETLPFEGVEPPSQRNRPLSKKSPPLPCSVAGRSWLSARRDLGAGG